MISKIKGDKSIPPKTVGITRRISPKAGSVMAYKTCTILLYGFACTREQTAAMMIIQIYTAITMCKIEAIALSKVATIISIL